MDVPPPRKLDINEKHINQGRFTLYEAYLNMVKHTDSIKITEPDPEEAKIPKIAINNDITLKESLVSGNREKDRTKPERDQAAKDMARERDQAAKDMA